MTVGVLNVGGGGIHILIDARIHDTVNRRPCNIGGVINKEEE